MTDLRPAPQFTGTGLIPAWDGYAEVSKSSYRAETTGQHVLVRTTRLGYKLPFFFSLSLSSLSSAGGARPEAASESGGVNRPGAPAPAVAAVSDKLPYGVFDPLPPIPPPGADRTGPEVGEVGAEILP